MAACRTNAFSGSAGRRLQEAWAAGPALTVLSLEIIDHLTLLLVDLAGEGDNEEPERVGQRRHEAQGSRSAEKPALDRITGHYGVATTAIGLAISFCGASLLLTAVGLRISSGLGVSAFVVISGLMFGAITSRPLQRLA